LGGDFPGAARENGGGPRTHRWSLLGTSLPFGGSTAVVGAFLFDLEGFQSLATTAQTPPTLIRKVLLLFSLGCFGEIHSIHKDKHLLFTNH
jgi:hypothetical protein